MTKIIIRSNSKPLKVLNAEVTELVLRFQADTSTTITSDIKKNEIVVLTLNTRLFNHLKSHYDIISQITD
jgi:hypothetical protein